MYADMWKVDCMQMSLVQPNVGFRIRKKCLDLKVRGSKDYDGLINTAQNPYEEIFLLTFKAYEANAVKSMCLEHQSKYFP